MALFNECMPQCAQKVFDTADIVRDRDLSPTIHFESPRTPVLRLQLLAH
jgi:hypothetical protein